MSIQNRNTLKGYFNTGDTPTESQFIDFIDSIVNIAEDKVDSSGVIDIENDTSFVTPKSVKKLIDGNSVTRVNNITPDTNGNVTVTDITGTALSITGNILKSQVTGLEADLNSKVDSGNIKTINSQNIIGTGNIEISGSNGPVKLMAVPSAPYSIPLTAQANAFPATCDTFLLQSNKTYLFKGKYYIANGTSHTVSIGWNTTGLAVSSIEYVANLFSSVANAYATASSHTQVSGTALKVLNSSTASATTTVVFEGILRCTTGGTITPIIAFSTPTSTPQSTMKVGSFIEFIEIGDNLVQSVGDVD